MNPTKRPGLLVRLLAKLVRPIVAEAMRPRCERKLSVTIDSDARVCVAQPQAISGTLEVHVDDVQLSDAAVRDLKARILGLK
jgi:hypothetical protein